MLNHNAEIPPYYQEMPCSSNIAIIINLNTFCWYSCMYSNLASQSVNCQAKQTLAGSSGSVRYDSLPSGTYIFRIVAKAANGERDIDRRKIHIGMCDCMALFSNTRVDKSLYSEQFSNAYWHKNFMCNSVHILCPCQSPACMCTVHTNFITLYGSAKFQSCSYIIPTSSHLLICWHSLVIHEDCLLLCRVILFSASY